LQDTGLTNVAHIDGGFAEWKKQAAPIQTLAEHQEASHRARAARTQA
jgi:3-mercaptopyruvate sulfurtransferase SseA